MFWRRLIANILDCLFAWLYEKAKMIADAVRAKTAGINQGISLTIKMRSTVNYGLYKVSNEGACAFPLAGNGVGDETKCVGMRFRASH